MAFELAILATLSHHPARVTRITTPHGTFTTPCFMPVATRAWLNHMSVDELVAAGSSVILGGNTYHMLVSPGMDVIQNAGGMHPFMHWQGPMLTDSGGFQVWSLSKNSNICKVHEKGARFKHPVTGQLIDMTPKSAIETQKIIGADMIMAFDQCSPDTDDITIAEHAMQTTHRWLLESIETHQQHTQSSYGHEQALFGIIQGAGYRELREKSAEFVASQPVDGIAIGGETIGFSMPKTREIIDWVRPLLPANKPRYTMGVGLCPQDLFDVVKAGIDLFDCVAPSRNARHGALYHGEIIEQDNWLAWHSPEPRARILIKKQQYAKDLNPICEHCTCHTCQHYTRSYLHFLFKSRSSLYYALACVHNIHRMQDACRAMQHYILSMNQQETAKKAILPAREHHENIK